MWLMTPRGFFSAVQKREDGLTRVTVRARCKEDIDGLAELLPDCKPFKTQFTDYPWRLRCTSAEWAQACATMALEVTYPNFKDEVKRVQGGKRAEVYGRLWAVLLSLEHPARRRAEERRLDDWYAVQEPLYSPQDELGLDLMDLRGVDLRDGDPLDDSFLGHVVGCTFSSDRGWDCHPNCEAWDEPPVATKRRRPGKRRRRGRR